MPDVSGASGTIPGAPGAAPAASTSSSAPAGNTFSSFLTGSSYGATPGNTSALGTVPGSTTTGTQIQTPTAAVSPYYYQSIIIGAQNVEIGAAFAELLNLPPGTYSGAAIMQAYMDMPLANAVQLQTLLNNAGYYTKASTGVPLQRQQAGDIHSPAGQDAMALAILDAVNQKGDLSQIVVQNASSGVGEQINAQALTPIQGGANTYQINPIDTATGYSALYNAFESSLGRAPTQDELNNFMTSYNAQLTSFQAAQNTQKEQMSRNVYQSQIASRDATHGMTAIPPAGGIPAATDPWTAAESILTVMGMRPTASNLQAVAAMIDATGGFTAQSTSILGITPPNSTGPASLIEAAANLLNNGKYEKLNLGLAAGTGSQAMSDPQVAGEVTQLTGGKKVTVSATPSARAVFAAGLAAGATGPPIPANMAQAGIPGSGIAGPPLSQAPLSVQNSLAGIPGSGVAGPPASEGPQSAPATTPTPLQQTNAGQTLSSPGDTYLAPNTLTQPTPPTPGEAAMTASQTGANAVPYLGNQFLQAYETIASLLRGGLTSAPL